MYYFVTNKWNLTCAVFTEYYAAAAFHSYMLGNGMPALLWMVDKKYPVMLGARVHPSAERV